MSPLCGEMHSLTASKVKSSLSPLQDVSPAHCNSRYLLHKLEAKVCQYTKQSNAALLYTLRFGHMLILKGRKSLQCNGSRSQPGSLSDCFTFHIREILFFFISQIKYRPLSGLVFLAAFIEFKT